VTGAASGIGRATARRLAADGAAVVVDHLGDAEAAGVLVAEIERDGGRAIAVEADVSDEAQVDAMFARGRDELGPVDVLVNNAGREKPFALLDMPLEEWNAVLALKPPGLGTTPARSCARRWPSSGSASYGSSSPAARSSRATRSSSPTADGR